MIAEPIRALELHYPMIQILINIILINIILTPTVEATFDTHCLQVAIMTPEGGS